MLRSNSSLLPARCYRVGRVVRSVISVSLISFSITSTNAQLDSLRKLLPTLSEDTTKANVLSDLSFLYSSINADTSEIYHQQAFVLSRKLSYPRGLASAFYARGYLKWVKGDITGCISDAERSIEIADSIGDAFIKYKALRNIGGSYYLLGDVGKALEYYQSAEQGFSNLGQTTWSSWLLSTIGYVYLERNDLAKAENNLLKSFSKARARDAHYNTLVFNIALLRVLQNRLKESDSIISISLPAIRNSSRQKGYAQYVIARHHLAKHELKKAKKAAQNAVTYYQEAKFMNGLKNSTKLLADIEFNEGNFSGAYKFLTYHITLQDSLQIISARNRTNLYELKDEARQKTIIEKENELKSATLRNRQNTLGGTILFLSVTIVGLIIYLKQKQKLNSILASQNNVLESKQNELLKLNKQLAQREDDLLAYNEELTQQQEEIASQRDAIARQNEKLHEANMLIASQNTETLSKNEWLESEVKNRTNKLVEYNQQLEQYAFITAHNLRSPVARILGLGNVLKLIPTGTEEHRHIQSKLLGEVKELDMVIKDLNSIIEVKQNVEIKRLAVDLGVELDKIKNILSADISQSGCDIVADFRQVPTVHSIQAYIYSILINLITNAIKYRDPVRKLIIKIETLSSDKSTVLRVSDNGLGIDLAVHAEKIFTVGSRFHNHTAGKGFGLFLVKNQVTALNGTIEVASEVNEGTTFTMSFREQ